MTDYSKLLSQRKLEAGRFSVKQIADCLAIAKRDLEMSQAVFSKSREWAFNIAYNAMHLAGRAYMFHRGYRTRGEGHHATVIEFLEISLPDIGETLAVMDRMRRKRNQAVYGMIGTISPKEAEEAIAMAKEFVEKIGKILGESQPLA